MEEKLKELKEEIENLKGDIEWWERHLEGIRSSIKHTKDNWHSLKKRGGRFDPDRTMSSLESQETSALRRLSSLKSQKADYENTLEKLKKQQ